MSVTEGLRSIAAVATVVSPQTFLKVSPAIKANENPRVAGY